MLTVIADWFIEQPDPVKKMYMTIVMANEPRYIVRAEPTSKTIHVLDSYVSICSWQYSAQWWARSTRRTRPIRRNKHAPITAMYLPQKTKNCSGMNQVKTRSPIQARIFGPQKPFCIGARPSFELRTPSNMIAMIVWKTPRAKLMRWTATKP